MNPKEPFTTPLSVLEEIQQRVLWLSCRMVDAANRERETIDGVKVGGHQASSASLVTAMTSLWFDALGPHDLVAVKPHASPVFHSIQYLLGNLDAAYLTRLREQGGLQAYPSRTKDPDAVDFSTGSVGLGAAATLFGAVTDRYLRSHGKEMPPRRFIALVGDAELDEGNIWEAVADPSTQGLGNVVWIVDLNRQSLDRIVPGIKATRLESMFRENGWNVEEAKYGRLLSSWFRRPGGEALRDYIDDMPNERYQRLFALGGEDFKESFLDGAPSGVRSLFGATSGDEVADVVRDLGGHDLVEVRRSLRSAWSSRTAPSVIFAYTIKGWGLPIAGDPLNHSALLSEAQIDGLREASGLQKEGEWDRFDDASPAGVLVGEVATSLRRPTIEVDSTVGRTVPRETGAGRSKRPTSTQETFGRVLSRLADGEAGRSIVTTSPDVAVSTNLGAWINKVGVFSPSEKAVWGEPGVLRWQPGPSGQHIELGISEMNLFLLLSQLGLSSELFGTELLPVGTVYDPFILRGLDALIYSLYSDARFILVGTPSGVTLAPEGGAHQSTMTPSVGIELPGIAMTEPAFGTAVDWLLCDGLARLHGEEGESLYLRLTTRAIDQEPFEAARRRLGDEALRQQVIAGGYRLIDRAAAMPDAPIVQLVASGAVIPEVVAASEALADEGVAANVIVVTSPSRLYQGWRKARQRTYRELELDLDWHLTDLIPEEERGAHIVTVHDAHSHALAWLGSVFGVRTVPVGVDSFGESGSVSDVYAVHDLEVERIVNAAIVALNIGQR